MADKINDWLYGEVELCGMKFKKGLFVLLSIFLVMVAVYLKPKTASDEAKYLMKNHIHPIAGIFTGWVEASEKAEREAKSGWYGGVSKGVAQWTIKATMSGPSSSAALMTESEIRKLKEYLDSNDIKHDETIKYGAMIIEWAEQGLDVYRKHEHYVECLFGNKAVLREAEKSVIIATDKFLGTSEAIKLHYDIITGAR